VTFWTYLLDNANYYLVVLITLFLYDLVDLYIELKNFRFLRRLPFLVYYLVAAFFSITTLEAGYLLNLFTTESKYVVAFFVPLIFAIVLENLVVRIGDVEKSIDLSEFFDKFRFAIRESLIRQEEITKVQIQTELLKSKISNEEILDWCRFYSTDEELKGLIDKISKMSPKGQRIEAIKYLVRKAKDVAIAKILSRGAS
jgi:hypothetical protein